MTQNGTVIASIAAGAAINSLSMLSNASTSTDNTITFNTVVPTVAINKDASQADPTNAQPIHFTAVFNVSCYRICN